MPFEGNHVDFCCWPHQMSGVTKPPVSPYVLYEAADFAGAVIRITITFDGSNNLTGATVFRDAACLYRHIYIGVGADGTPDSSTMKFAVPSGTTSVTQSQLNSVGLTTVASVLAFQITAGP